MSNLVSRDSRMILYNSLFIIVVISSATCSELFHYPIGQIKKARSECTKDASITPDCLTSCALEKSNMLTPEGNALNSKEFGKFYMQYAQECWVYSAKPTCEEANTFIQCYHNKSNTATSNIMDTCQKQHPVENIRSIQLTHEELEKSENLACMISCYGEYAFAFTPEDKIDVDCVNPHLKFEFNAGEAAKKCEEQYTKGSKCQIRANIYLCLIRSYEKAFSEHHKV